MFGAGRHKYTFETVCREDRTIWLGEERTTIFLNADSQMEDVSKELTAFLNYAAGCVSEDPFVKKLDEAVKEAKRNREWRREYMTLLMRDQENIEKGVFELGLVTEPVDTSRFETLHLQRKERWGALVREDDPLSEKEFIYPDDVKDKSLILPVRTEVRYILEGWFGASFQDLNIAARYNLGRNVAVMVRSGLGIGICFDLFSNYEGLRFIPMIPPLMTGSAVCWKKNQLFSTVTRSFIEFLKNTN